MDLKSVALRQEQGEKLVDIANEIGISPGTLRVKLSRYRKENGIVTKVGRTPTIEKAPSINTSNEVIDKLVNRIKKLEREIYDMKERLPTPRVKGTHGKSPRRDQIMDYLKSNPNSYFSFKEIAETLGIENYKVRHCVNGMPDGLVHKIKVENNKTLVRLRIIGNDNI